MESGFVFSTLFGCLIVSFIGWQGYLVVRYAFLKLTKPDDKHKFPVLALLIFLLCCGFYVVVFILDYTGVL